ncbi:hypothetical protein K443DRAFT_10789 [Laccaria amethystina LaAM-08-1]|uniref:Uncharacterized protein n=1 Tax=Laccaria amethystina LaAM-08-1 TaxID=1095629 RepID=A0A0C9WV04_9AGAR|nr:hypothetical protein K443DRAFT_10789 [Laccaria amethystina LaAM-08-1]
MAHSHSSLFPGPQLMPLPPPMQQLPSTTQNGDDHPRMTTPADMPATPLDDANDTSAPDVQDEGEGYDEVLNRLSAEDEMQNVG